MGRRSAWLPHPCFPLGVVEQLTHGRPGPRPVRTGAAGKQEARAHLCNQVECLSGYYHCTAWPVRHNGWPLSSRPGKPARGFCQDGPFQPAFWGQGSNHCTHWPSPRDFCSVAAEEPCVPDQPGSWVPTTAVICSEGGTWDLRVPATGRRV